MGTVRCLFNSMRDWALTRSNVINEDCAYVDGGIHRVDMRTTEYFLDASFRIRRIDAKVPKEAEIRLDVVPSLDDAVSPLHVLG